jgi:acetyl esterase/lipase
VLRRGGVSRTTIRYGRHRANVAELWRPRGAIGELPVVALVHGGYWKAQYTKRLMHRLARAVTEQGWVAWNVEYRRVGHLGGGGGWPETFVDIAGAVDALDRIPGLDRGRIVTCGHSAGGQLALWAAARHRLPPGAPGADPVVAPRGAVSLAGVVDLRRGADLGLGGGAVAALLGGGPDRHPDRYAVGSPAALVPLGVGQALVHGLEDETVPAAMSERYCREALAAGDRDVRYLPVPGVGHMALISPRAAAWPVLREQLERLLG